EAQGWVTSGQHPRPIGNWQAKLMQWKVSQPQFEPQPRSPQDATPRRGAAGHVEVVRTERAQRARHREEADVAERNRRVDAALAALPDAERARLEAEAGRRAEAEAGRYATDAVRRSYLRAAFLAAYPDALTDNRS